MTKRLFISIALVLIVGLSYSQSSDDFAKSIYGRNPKAGHYAKINGFNMYYETYGEGEPLLIIHGNGSSINSFTYQIPYFAKHYKVIIADSRAQGKSIDTGNALSYEMMAEDLNALLDSLHIKSCNIIGWSDGGINGLLLAMKHPDKVKKLAITGANLWPDATAVDSKVIDLVVKDQDLLSKQSPTAETKHAMKLMNLLINEPHISVDQLNTIKCPTLVIGGDHDVILPTHTMLIAQSIPKSYLWIIPNSGHSIPIFHKDQFNKAVYDFFEKPFRTIEGLDRFN